MPCSKPSQPQMSDPCGGASCEHSAEELPGSSQLRHPRNRKLRRGLGRTAAERRLKTRMPVRPNVRHDDVAFVLEGLEEPAIDAGGSLITSTIDDENSGRNPSRDPRLLRRARRA